MSTRTTRRAQSQAPLTHQESLLLAQAVWQEGASPSSWASVSKLLSKHPLLSRPKAFFSAQACHTMYEQLMKDAELEINDACHAPRATENRKLAEKHYQLRHSELKNLILEEESKFKTVLKEIEAIRNGSTEQKQEDDTVEPSSAKEVIEIEDESNEETISVTTSVKGKAAAETETDGQTPQLDTTQLDTNAIHTSDAAGTAVQDQQQVDQEGDGDMQEPAESNDVEDQPQDAEPEEATSEADNMDASERTSQLREEEEEDELVLKQAEEEESKDEEEEEASQGQPEEDVQMENEAGGNAAAEAQSSEEETPMVATRRSTRRRKSSAASLQAPPKKRLRSQGRMSVEQDEQGSDDEEDAEEGERKTPAPDDEQPSSPFEESTTRRGKRKASYQEGSPSDKKRMREDSEPVEEDESGPSTNTRGGRATRQGTRGEDKAALKRFQSVIGLLHSQISQHRNGNIFHNPIKNSEAPDYLEIVKRPMDLKTIKTRVKDGVIGNSLEFQRDIFLMFANSLMYNRPGSDVHAMAEDMMLDSEAHLNEFRQTEGLVKRGQRP